MTRALSLGKLSDLSSPAQILSGREFDLFRLIVDGHGNPAVAKQLGLSQKSVSNYLVRIKNKLGVDSIAGMVRLSLRYDRSDEDDADYDKRSG